MFARWMICVMVAALATAQQQPVKPQPQPQPVKSPTKPAQQALKRDLVIAQDTVQQLPAVAKRFALVIGVDKYDDPQLNSLRGAANDARILADAFIRYAGFPASQTFFSLPTNPKSAVPLAPTS